MNNNKFFLSNFGSTFSGRYSYIYIIYSRLYNLAYVGETNEKRGVIGRFTNHITTNEGTFRRYFEEYTGLSIDSLSDLSIFSYSFSDDLRFLGTEKRFRQAVEYLVYKQLLSTNTVPLTVIGITKYNDSCLDRDIRYISELIVSKFVEAYKEKSY